MSVENDDGTRPAAAGLLRTGSESKDRRTREEHVVCNRPQEDGRSERDQYQTLGERATLSTLQEGSVCTDAKG